MINIELECEYRLRALQQGYVNAYAQLVEKLERDLSHWKYMHNSAWEEVKKHESNITAMENEYMRADR